MNREVLYLKVPYFPIAVERLRDPSLRERPVAICAPGTGRSLLQAVSAEARQDGLFKGMSRQEARRACPGVRLIAPDPGLYGRAAHPLFRLLSDHSPLVEPIRPGALFLDLSGTRRLFGPARDLAWKLRKEIRSRLGLAPRLGMAANKLVSRIAVTAAPAGDLCDVFPGGERLFLEPQAVTVLPAARGPVCAEMLSDLNIEKVTHLLPIPLPTLQLAFGRNSLPLFRQARALDSSPVRPPAKTPCITEEETLPEESNEDALLFLVLQGLVEGAGVRLRRMGAMTGRMALEVQYADAMLARRSYRLKPPTDLDRTLFRAARELLEMTALRRVRIRRLTLFCTRIEVLCRQPELFPGQGRAPAAQRQESLQQALDEIRHRFGKTAIRTGTAGGKGKENGKKATALLGRVKDHGVYIDDPPPSVWEKNGDHNL